MQQKFTVLNQDDTSLLMKNGKELSIYIYIYLLDMLDIKYIFIYIYIHYIYRAFSMCLSMGQVFYLNYLISSLRGDMECVFLLFLFTSEKVSCEGK